MLPKFTLWPEQPMTASAGATGKAKSHSAAKAPARGRLGTLPEWNLADLYSGLDDPAVKRDLDRIDSLTNH